MPIKPTPLRISTSYDIGADAHGGRITLIQSRDAKAREVFTLQRVSSDQRDPDQVVSGLTAENLRVLGAIAGDDGEETA